MISRLDSSLKVSGALTIFVLICLAVLPCLSSRDANKTTGILREVAAKELAFNRVLSLLKDAETGQRGFLLSSDESFLEPYNTGVEGLPAALDEIERVASSSSEKVLATKISELSKAKLAELGETVALKRAGRAKEAIDIVENRHGKLLMDELRALLSRQLSSLSKRRAVLQEDITASLGYNAALSVGASLFSLVLVCASILIAANSLKKRSEAAEQARTLADSNALYAEQSALRAQRLATTAQLLQALDSVGSPAELGTVLPIFLKKLLPGSSGTIYLYRHSRDLLEAQTHWGSVRSTDNALYRHDCWGLRLGKVHRATHGDDLCCEHDKANLGTQRTQVCIPMISQGDVIGLMVIAEPDHNSLPLDNELMTALAEQLSLAISNVSLRETLKQQSTVDALTGLYNRRYFDESLKRELARAKRTRSSCSVIMVDLDHFKRINDSYGHDAGDLVLKAAAKQLFSRLRASDVACRYGGEELVLLLPECEAEAAAKCAEGIRRALSDIEFDHLGQRIAGVTASFGVAAWPTHGSDSSELVKAADKALYSAKRAGRNRVTIAGSANETLESISMDG
ncbi:MULTISPECIES: diguanylate cyclase [unclassified Massilia]|uniref:diguanylate cyclase n=1 Tax=unclassified Massilia TaxID=2609279 RepID=UPI0009E7253C|nr:MULTISPECIES: diguanylate cyclase [unclassified Massilia]